MAATTNDELRIAEIPTGVTVDPVTLDIIEGALKNARYEMDAVLFRSAMSQVIREQHDEFPMITDPRGRMVVGQFGAYINEMMEDWDRGIYPGDVILTCTPAGVGLGQKPPVYLKPGDVVTASIECLGEQTHKVVRLDG